MPYVNKNSLREEFTGLKSEFEKLTAENKITKESRVLFKAMLMLFEVMLVVFMEKTTKKDSCNSSKPSSQTEKDETSIVEGSKSKGKKENSELFDNTRTKETIKRAAVNECDSCGENLQKVPSQPYERRTKIDIIFEKVVCHVDAEVKQCPHCKANTKGRFPADMQGPLQYGPGIKAYLLNLLVAQMISLNRIQKSIKALIGMAICEATILKYARQLYLALEVWKKTSLEKLLLMPSCHVDETSLRVDKKNQWIHVYSSGEITLKFVHPKRGKEAIEDIGIIPRYGGVIIHDCWASYLSYEHCDHGLCGSLLRELTFVVDSNGYAWAANMKALLQKTCATVSKRKRKKLTQSAYKSVQKRYRTILTCGDKELPPIPGLICSNGSSHLRQRVS